LSFKHQNPLGGLDALSYEMSDHIAKHKFMSNYLVWHQYGEVQAATPAELDGSNDEDRMDGMIAHFGICTRTWWKSNHIFRSLTKHIGHLMCNPH
jgi:hypothetical protein